MKDDIAHIQKEILGLTATKYHGELENAFALANKIYGSTMRLNGESYFQHACKSALFSAIYKMDTESIIATLLHHAFYDQSVSGDVEAIIRQQFGDSTVALIKQLRDVNIFTKTANIRNYKTLTKYLLSGVTDLRVSLIKLWEISDNSNKIDALDDVKKKHFIQKSFQSYGILAEYFNLGALKKNIEENAFKSANPDLYDFIQESLQERNISEYLHLQYQDYIAELLTVSELKGEIKSRLKSKFSIYKKLYKVFDEGKYPKLDEFNDIIAFAVILPTVEDCYNFKKTISEFGIVDYERSDDYITKPKPNGFSQIQLAVTFNEISDLRIEMQIMTPEMYHTNTYGTASHIAYKAARTRFVKPSKSYFWIEDIHNKIKVHQQFSSKIFSSVINPSLIDTNIYATTPKGMLIVLNQGDTVATFAKWVHSSFPKAAVMGKIDGRAVKLDAEVNNGNVVEIVLDKQRLKMATDRRRKLI